MYISKSYSNSEYIISREFKAIVSSSPINHKNSPEDFEMHSFKFPVSPILDKLVKNLKFKNKNYLY